MAGKGTRRQLALAASIAASLLGCSGDLGLNDFQFACQNDSDCGEGGRCNPAVGCVSMDAGRPDGGTTDAAIPPDGGHDAGRDAGVDGGPVAADAGHEDSGHYDSGQDDAGDAGQDDDGGGDIDVIDAGDAGVADTGTFALTWSSLYQAGAGSCASADYRITSVTGWVTLPSGFSQTNVLRPESPVKK